MPEHTNIHTHTHTHIFKAHFIPSFLPVFHSLILSLSPQLSLSASSFVCALQRAHPLPHNVFLFRSSWTDLWLHLAPGSNRPHWKKKKPVWTNVKYQSTVGNCKFLEALVEVVLCTWSNCQLDLRWTVSGFQWKTWTLVLSVKCSEL